MIGGPQHDFSATRSEEVYPGAQQTGHRRGAEAERLGGCQDVRVDGRSGWKTEHTALRSHTAQYADKTVYKEASLALWEVCLVKHTSCQQMFPANLGLFSREAAACRAQFDISPPVLSFSVSDSAGCLLLQLS